MSASTPSRRRVYDGHLPNVATVLYTYDGGKRGVGSIVFSSFCNTDSVARTVTLALVRSGGTITATQYRILNAVSLDPNQSLIYTEDAGADGAMDLLDGDSIVAYASAASVVACRIIVQERNAS